MRRTAEDAARTRVALLEAALESFEEKGWRGATFEHVARRAGVTRGAVHHHFRDKRALLLEALEWGWADYGQRLFAGTDSTGGDGDAGCEPETRSGDAVATLVSRFVRLLTGDARFRALASTTVLVAPQAFEGSGKGAALDDWHERIEGIVATSGWSASRLTPGETAGLVLVLLQGFTVTAALRPHDLPQSDKLDSTITVLVRGLLGS